MKELVPLGISVLVCLYEIFVIYSLEMMYREQPLPMTQPPAVTYNGYPQQQASYIITQPYNGPPSQDFNHPTAPYPTLPPSYQASNMLPEKS